MSRAVRRTLGRRVATGATVSTTRVRLWTSQLWPTCSQSTSALAESRVPTSSWPRWTPSPGAWLLAEITAWAGTYSWGDTRLMAALALVAAIRDRSAFDMESADVIMADLPQATQRDFLAFAARKLGQRADTEGLLSLLDSPADRRAEAAVMAGVTGPVRQRPWAPPGDMPIPMYIGGAAHDAIGKHYSAARRGEDVYLNHWPISRLVMRLAMNGIGRSENLSAQAVGQLASRARHHQSDHPGALRDQAGGRASRGRQPGRLLCRGVYRGRRAHEAGRQRRAGNPGHCARARGALSFLLPGTRGDRVPLPAGRLHAACLGTRRAAPQERVASARLLG